MTLRCSITRPLIRTAYEKDVIDRHLRFIEFRQRDKVFVEESAIQIGQRGRLFQYIDDL